MSLAPNTMLGGYQIVALLGAGAMGEVYLARDTALNRDVAVKILPAAFANDPERLARFTREAQLLAALNHPNIAQVYGLHRLDAKGLEHAAFIAMELAPGEDLAARIARGPVAVDEAVGIARQIADALDAAHAQGIVHRDLKPANIKVSADGAVKVLDFGLAKAMERSSGSDVGGVTNSPTLISPVAMTGAGTILGTAAYMAPEQARGRAVDKRADLWAFGCILFEMLAGRRPFDGDSIGDVVAAILREEPPWAALPAATPAGIRTLLARCLARDPYQRLRDAGDARLELDAPSAADDRPTVALPSNRSWRGVVAAALAVVLTAVAASALTWTLARPIVREAEVSRYSIPLARDAPLDVSGPWSSLAISRDGRTIAYIAKAGRGRQLYLRRADVATPHPVAGAVWAWEAFFSPDGQWLAFIEADQLKKVALTGGQPQVIANAVNLNSGVWADDGSIYLGGRAGLVRVDAGGKSTTLLTPQPSEVELCSPDLLPGGQLLFTIKPYDVTSFNDARIAVLMPGGERRVVIEGGATGRYSRSGHIVYARGADLMAVPFDAARLVVSGQPFTVEHGAMFDEASAAAHYALTPGGTLVFAPGGPVRHERSLAWVDRGGTAVPLQVPNRFYSEPHFSRDGRQLAFSIRSANDDIWIYDVARGTFARLTFTRGNNEVPVWSADGSRVAYAVDRLGVRRIAARPSDGSGEEQMLTPAEYFQTPGSFSPDGTVLAYTEERPDTGADLYVQRLTGPRTAAVFLATPFQERRPIFSPDGRWIAYESNETGRFEVFAAPYPGPGRKWQLSNGGGVHPVWSRNGAEVLYATADQRLMRVAVKAAAESFSPGTPREWLKLPASATDFDISPDGERVLAIEAGGDQGEVHELNVVLNWFETLKAPVH